MKSQSYLKDHHQDDSRHGDILHDGYSFRDDKNGNDDYDNEKASSKSTN